jgi:hypothetical protein
VLPIGTKYEEEEIPDRIFIGQYEATLVWGPETGADCNFEIPDQIVGL